MNPIIRVLTIAIGGLVSESRSIDLEALLLEFRLIRTEVIVPD